MTQTTIFACTLLGGVLMVGCGDPGHGQTAAPEMAGSKQDDLSAAGGVVVPKGQRVLNYTLGEWEAKWWIWNLTLPEVQHPQNGGDCGVGLSGGVLFLVEPDANVPSTYRCTVPGGTYFFVANNNCECSTAPGDSDLTQDGGQVYPPTVEGLRTCASFFVPLITDDRVEVDHVPVRNPLDFDIHSDFFAYGIPAGLTNHFGTPPGVYGSTADGIHMMIAPLRPGKHTIRSFSAEKSLDWFEDATYEITVLP